MSSSEIDELGRETGAMARAMMQAAMMIGQHLARRNADRARRAIDPRTRDREQLTRRLGAERRVAESFLALATTDQWWKNASRASIADAWCTAVAWRYQSPKAAEAAGKLRQRITDKYGFDPDTRTPMTGMAHTVPLTEQTLAEAAWRHHRNRRDDREALNAVDMAAIRDELDREALYAFVVQHEQATSELNRLSTAAEDGDTSAEEISDELATQHETLIAAENAIRGLGRTGEEWLRQFDDDRDRAYASVLIAPEPAQQARMWEIGRRLAAARASQVEAGQMGTDNDIVLGLHAEMAAVGEPGERWLASHRISLASGDAHAERSLTWLLANESVEKEALAHLEATVHGTEPTTSTEPATEPTDTASARARGTGRARGPQNASIDPAKAKFTDKELAAAQAYFDKKDPEQMRKWTWKLGNLADTDYGRVSVFNEMVTRWRKETYDTPARRHAFAEQLAEAGIDEQAKKVRLATDITNAHPATESTRAPAAPAERPAPQRGIGREARDFDLGG